MDPADRRDPIIKPSPGFDYDEVSSGIRGAVRFLRERGFCTTDSGDGSNHLAGMEGAMEEPMVACVAHPHDLLAEADRLHLLLVEHGLKRIHIQASYDPADEIGTLLIVGRDLISL